MIHLYVDDTILYCFVNSVQFAVEYLNIILILFKMHLSTVSN